MWNRRERDMLEIWSDLLNQIEQVPYYPPMKDGVEVNEENGIQSLSEAAPVNSAGGQNGGGNAGQGTTGQGNPGGDRSGRLKDPKNNWKNGGEHIGFEQ